MRLYWIMEKITGQQIFFIRMIKQKSVRLLNNLTLFPIMLFPTMRKQSLLKEYFEHLKSNSASYGNLTVETKYITDPRGLRKWVLKNIQPLKNGRNCMICISRSGITNPRIVVKE